MQRRRCTPPLIPSVRIDNMKNQKIISTIETVWLLLWTSRRHFLLLMLFVVFNVFAAEDYKTYVNERYGYLISYPADFLPQGVSDSGDGQVFLSPTSDAELRVFAGSCVDGINSTPVEYVAGYEKEQKAKRLTISYQRRGKHFAVVSGHKKGRIFYDKILAKEGWCTEFTFEYDERQAAKYGEVTNHLASSFKN
jgi:hypothetical protein